MDGDVLQSAVTVGSRWLLTESIGKPVVGLAWLEVVLVDEVFAGCLSAVELKVVAAWTLT